MKKNNNYKSGISLITLIITIIVVIILAVAIILVIAKANPINSANEAVFKQDVAVVQELLNEQIGNITLDNMHPPTLYMDNTYTEKVEDRVRINKENEKVGYLYYMVNGKKGCIIFGREGTPVAKIPSEIAATEPVVENIEYSYTGYDLPTYQYKGIKWYVNKNNKIELWINDKTYSDTGENVDLDIDEAGTYKMTVNAGSQAKWLGVELRNLQMPDGAKIEYSFQTSDDRVTFDEAVSNIEDVRESQYLKVVVNLIPNSVGRSPAFSSMKVRFNTGFKPEEIEEKNEVVGFEPQVYNGQTMYKLTSNSGSLTQVYDFGTNYTSTNANIRIEVPVNIGGTITYVTPGTTSNGTSVKAYVSQNGVNYTESVVTAGYRYVKVVTTSTNKQAYIGKAEIGATSKVAEKDYTIMKLEYYEVDAGGVGTWLSIEKDEVVPEGTKIRYSFAKSNDEKTYTEYSEDIKANGDSRYIKVKVEYIVDEDKTTKVPVLNDLIVNYKLNGQTVTKNVFNKLYVSTRGNDETGTGKYDKPFATLSKAIEEAESGNEIYIAEGTYNLAPMKVNEYAQVGIYDMGKEVEIYGEKEKTILIYNGSSATSRDGSAIQFSNKNSILKNLVYEFKPKSGSNYSKSIFRFSAGTVENVFFRITGNNRASYLYGTNKIIITNCTFFHDIGTVDGNYSGTGTFTNIATNVNTNGTNSNVQTDAFCTKVLDLNDIINYSQINSKFNQNRVGVFFGKNAWEKKNFNTNVPEITEGIRYYTLDADGKIANSMSGEYGIRLINKDPTSIGMEYKYSTGSWIKYEDVIRPTTSDYIIARYIYANKQADMVSYKYYDRNHFINFSSILTDGNYDSNMIVHAGSNGANPGTNNGYIRLDPSLIGKTFNIKWYSWGYSAAYTATIDLVDSKGDVLKTKVASVASGTITSSFRILNNTEFLKLYFPCSDPGWGTNYRIYEIYITD